MKMINITCAYKFLDAPNLLSLVDPSLKLHKQMQLFSFIAVEAEAWGQ